MDTTALEAAIKSAENLTESDYTAASWFDLCVELKEAKDELAAPHTQSTVDEATEHLNAAIKALVKAETKEETKTDVTKLNAVIEKAEALKQRHSRELEKFTDCARCCKETYRCNSRTDCSRSGSK